MKVCKGECGEYKALSEFYCDRQRIHYSALCKLCYIARQCRYRLANLERYKEKGRQKYARIKADPAKLARCRISSRKAGDKWRLNNPEKVVQARKVYYAKPGVKEHMIAKNKAQYARRRQMVINAYGGKCVCCNETEPVFLAIDHGKSVV